MYAARFFRSLHNHNQIALLDRILRTLRHISPMKILVTGNLRNGLYALGIICAWFLSGCTTSSVQEANMESEQKSALVHSHNLDKIPDRIDRHPEPSFYQNTLSTAQQNKPTPSTAINEQPISLTLLDSIRDGFRLDHRLDVKRVQQEIQWLERHPKYVERITPRIKNYLPLICEQVRARDLPTELCLLPIIESSLDPYAYSHGGAAGLWQFIPGTATRFGLKIDWWVDERRDPYASTKAALDYLERLHTRFDDWLLAVASYNWGEGRIARQLRKNGPNSSFFDLKVPKETAGYVPRLLAYAAVFNTPEKYGINLVIPDTLAEPAQMAVINTVSQIDISTASQFTGLSIKELYRLNPALNQWATHPDGPHRLIVPFDIAVDAQKRLSEIEDKKRLAWVRHEISQNQTLSDLALLYRTDIATIKKANQLSSDRIRAGDHLMIPKPGMAIEDFRLVRQPSSENVVYTTQKGDSLWSIAQSYKVTINSLVKENKIGPREVLPVGRTIVIPKTRKNILRNPLVRTVNYVVRRGDSLSRIASRFNVTVNNIANWNKLDPKQLIHPGKKLVLRVNLIDPKT